MPYKVAFREQALSDLKEISDFVSKFDEAAAQRVIQRIHRTVYSTLATIPAAGRVNKETSAREFPVPGLPYLVIYNATDELIDVIGVFHTARDPQSKPRTV